MVLTLERSRVLPAWWLLLHVLLVVAALLIGWAVPLKLLAVGTIAVHGVVRRPPASPRTVVVIEGGRCIVPDWSTGARPLGPRTLISPFSVRLDLGTGPWRRDLVLLADQMPPETWRRLRALLLRARCE